MILISALIVTAIFNTTLLSKPNIIEIINYAMSLSDETMNPIDSLYVAKIIRQQLWEVHYLIGVCVTVLSIVLYVYYKYSKVHNNSIFINLILIIYMFTTGFLLHYRQEFNYAYDYIGVIRYFHIAGIYFAIIIIIFHIYTVLVFNKESVK